MKILIPLLSLSPHGGTRVLTEIANILADSGHEVKIIAGNLYKEPTYALDVRVQVEILPQGRGRLHSYWHLVNQISKFVDKGWMPVLNHALTFSAFLLPKRTLARSIIIIQDLDWRGVKQPFGMFMKLGGEMTIRKHQAIIAANPYLANEIRLIGNNVIGQLKLGISKVFCDSGKQIAEDDRDISFLFIARPQRRKRLNFYLEWIKHMAKLKPGIRVAAASQDNDVIATLIKMGGVQVYKPNNDMELKQLYERSKFLLLASSAEGFALPPLEAMGAGCIPVITDCGGPSIYARHNENSFILPIQSSPQYVALFCSDLLDFEVKGIDLLRNNARSTSFKWIVDNIYNANLIVSSFNELN